MLKSLLFIFIGLFILIQSGLAQEKSDQNYLKVKRCDSQNSCESEFVLTMYVASKKELVKVPAEEQETFRKACEANPEPSRQIIIKKYGELPINLCTIWDEAYALPEVDEERSSTPEKNKASSPEKSNPAVKKE